MPSIDRLYIAEKPAAAKALAEFLAKSTGAKSSVTRTHVTVGQDVVTWLRGHLLELVDAEVYDPRFAKWRLDDLPIIPKRFQLVPRKGRDGSRADATSHIASIKRLVADCREIIGFGDPDSEGQLIQDEILHHIGNKKPVLRLWANALDDSTLQKALDKLRPNEEYLGYYEQALCRSHSDWLYGINMTRACTVHARNAGSNSPVFIGRVQTPTLALIVQRELEILKFKAVAYFVPTIGLAVDPAFRADWIPKENAAGEVDDGRVNADGLLLDRTIAQSIVDLAANVGKAKVLRSETKPGTESSPLTFSQSGLQAHCSRLFGLGASQTLEVAQSLYDKKLASYPRVDSEYLPEDQHNDAPRVLASLGKSDLPTAVIRALTGCKPSLKSRVWNDAKVTAHHGIIPVHLDNPSEVSRLSEIELKVYIEIVKRYLLQFWPVAKFMSTELTLGITDGVQSESFSAKGRRYVDDGWRKAFAATEDAADESTDPVRILPQLAINQMVPVTEPELGSKTTKAKKRFTEGTLITAMKNIHEYVTDQEIRKRLREGAGIGTEATRAKIIDTLMHPKRDLIGKKGKDLVPTENGMRLIGLLPASMTTPDMTAVWQQFGDAVLARQTDYGDFIERQGKWLAGLVHSSSDFFKAGQFEGASKPAGGRQGGNNTEHKCFGAPPAAGCGAQLRLLNGKFGPFYKCSSESCGKTFKNVQGAPKEASSGPRGSGNSELEAYEGRKIKCRRCDDGYLLLKERRDKSGSFWGCSHWRDTDGSCKAIYNEINGEPDFDGASRGRGGASSGSGLLRMKPTA